MTEPTMTCGRCGHEYHGEDCPRCYGPGPDPDLAGLLEREFLASLDRRIPRGVARPITFRAAAVEAFRDAAQVALLAVAELREQVADEVAGKILARSE